MTMNPIGIEGTELGPESGAAVQLTESVSQSIAAIVGQIEALDAQKAKLVDELRAAQDRIAAEFGKHSKLLAPGDPASVVTTHRRGKADPNKVCSICGERGHDARRHRSGANKKGND